MRGKIGRHRKIMEKKRERGGREKIMERKKEEEENDGRDEGG